MDVNNNDLNNQSLPPQSNEVPGNKKIWLIGGGVLVLAILGGFAVHAYFGGGGFNFAPIATSTEQTSSTTDQTNSTNLYGTNTNMNTCGYAAPATTTPTTPITVSWNTPRPIPDPHILNTASTTFQVGVVDWMNSSYATTTKYYSVGMVHGGKYDGGTVILVLFSDVGIYDDEGGDSGETQYHFIQKGNNLTLVARNSDALVRNWQDPNVYDPNFDCSKYTVDTDSIFNDLVLPGSFTYNGASFTLKSGNNNLQYLPAQSFYGGDYNLLFTDHIAELKPVFTSPTLGVVYTDKKGSDVDYVDTYQKDNGSIGVGYSRVEQGLYLPAPDGTFRAYSMDMPSWYNDNTHIANITWSDSTNASAEYTPYDWGGCGATNFISVMTTLTNTDLTPAGKTSTDDTVYALANPNNVLLTTLYGQYKNGLQSEIDYEQRSGKPVTPLMTYDQFVAKHQMFFWYDPIGRLIKFQTSDYRTAECGKPVIYLYPTSTTKVSVQINPTGGMTVSDPAYNGGWNVLATPQSLLTDLATGLQYPYLFWEGGSKDIYQTPNKGWVVAKIDVHSFLTIKLAQLGLNPQETADFEAFWEPRMTGAPYYFVTFLNTQQINQIAPLSITPKPNTLIRILMDFHPLQQPVSVQGYEIRTPQRNGFTVVEWGGVLQ